MVTHKHGKCNLGTARFGDTPHIRPARKLGISRLHHTISNCNKHMVRRQERRRTSALWLLGKLLLTKRVEVFR